MVTYDVTTTYTTQFPSGKILQLTAPPVVSSGGRTYNFSRWEDNSTSRIRPNVTVTADKTFTATYVIVPQFTLTMVASVGGTISPSVGTHLYDQGTVVSCIATPDGDHTFDHWIVDATTSTTNPYQVTMNANHTLTPVFKARQVTLTSAAGTGGTVNPSGPFLYDIGATYNFTAIPDTVTYPNFAFDHWDLAGSNLGSQNPLPLRITSAMNNQTLRALFTQKPYDTITLTVAKVGTGTVNPYGTVTLNVDPVNPSTFTATPGSGFKFDHWEFSWDTTQPTASSISILITAAMQGTTITAVFTPIMYNVTIDSTPIKGVTITVTEVN